MKQVMLKQGDVVISDVPAPVAGANQVLVQVRYSCISTGTELAVLKSAAVPVYRRALRQPAAVATVLKMVRELGLRRAVQQVRTVLDAAAPLGYSAAGIVLEAGAGITDLRPGDPVACAGAGIANHAEFIAVPRNLVVPIPTGVDSDLAATVTPGAIAMQGVRRADLRLGERVAVIGLGLLGQLTVQLVKAAGCTAIGIDLDQRRVDRALALGLAHGFNPRRADAIREVLRLCDGYGADAVILTAATDSDLPVNQAMEMCRKRGKVVVVGAVGLDIARQDFYQKEIDLLMSTSYGPGRYDARYEQDGLDYPLAYVRWTENRNMASYLALLASGALNVRPLVDGVYPAEQAALAYRDLRSARQTPVVALLEYSRDVSPERTVVTSPPVPSDRVNVAVIGLGSFATAVHLPQLQRLAGQYRIHALLDHNGAKARQLADRYRAAYCTTEYQRILDDPGVQLVMICTRHDSHAALALRALQAGKHVFVEKPLATALEDLERIERFYGAPGGQRPLLMAGFNRRFSPMAAVIAGHTARRSGPLFMLHRINAGYLPREHWAHRDGGRIIGEACHAIDLMNYLTGARIRSVSSAAPASAGGQAPLPDCRAITLTYDDGSVGSIEYLSTGSAQLAKEYIEVHFDGKSIVLDDFRSLRGYGVALGAAGSGKGHAEELVRLHQALSGQRPGWPIELWDMAQTTRAALQSA